MTKAGANPNTPLTTALKLASVNISSALMVGPNLHIFTVVLFDSVKLFWRSTILCIIGESVRLLRHFVKQKGN